VVECSLKLAKIRLNGIQFALTEALSPAIYLQQAIGGLR
jgi:hypothetical protein